MRQRGQSRSTSMLEACTNVALGFVTALLVQSAIYPSFGIETTLTTDGLIAAVFTAVSLLRSYLVRRAFEEWAIRQERNVRCVAASRCRHT